MTAFDSGIILKQFNPASGDVPTDLNEVPKVESTEFYSSMTSRTVKAT